MSDYSIDGEDEPQKSSESSGRKVAFCSGADDFAAGLNHGVLRANELERFEAELDDLLSDDEVEDRADTGEVATGGLSKHLRDLVKAKRDAIAAENLAKKKERNKRRNAARRASPEYQVERKEARDAYAEKIAAEEGRDVRGYIKVPGETREERAAYAKAREADRKREARANADQASTGRRKVRGKPNNMTPKEVLDAMTPEEREHHDRDKNAEKQWVFGRRKAGWTEEKIEAERPNWWKRRLAKRGGTYPYRQPDSGKYEDNPEFGAF